MVATESSWFVLFVWNRWIRPGTNSPCKRDWCQDQKVAATFVSTDLSARVGLPCACVWTVGGSHFFGVPFFSTVFCVWFGRHCDWLLAASLLAWLALSLSLSNLVLVFVERMRERESEPLIQSNGSCSVLAHGTGLRPESSIMRSWPQSVVVLHGQSRHSTPTAVWHSTRTVPHTVVGERKSRLYTLHHLSNLLPPRGSSTYILVTIAVRDPARILFVVGPRGRIRDPGIGL